VVEIKELLGSLYSSFIGDEVGLRTELLYNLVVTLDPSIDANIYQGDVVRGHIFLHTLLIAAL
jgi:hypothetical protein